MNTTRIATEINEVMSALRSRNPAIVAVGEARWRASSSPASRVWNWEGEIAGADDRYREIAWVTEVNRGDLEVRELRIYAGATFRVVKFDPTHPLLEARSASLHGSETRDLCAVTLDGFYDFRIDAVAAVPHCTDLGRLGDRARRMWFSELLELTASAMRAVDVEEGVRSLPNFEAKRREMWDAFLWHCYEDAWGSRAGA